MTDEIDRLKQLVKSYKSILQDLELECEEWKDKAKGLAVQLKYTLSDVNEENSWIPIEEGLPPEGEFVLVWYKNTEGGLEPSCVDKWTGSDWRHSYPELVSHWKRIVAPAIYQEEVVITPPCEYNTCIREEDPGIYQTPGNAKFIWWHNTKDHRLWYWHNDQWNRGI